MTLIRRLYSSFRLYFSERYPRLYALCDKYKTIIKFAVAGCFAGGANLIFLFLFHGLFHWWLLVSTSLSFILSFAVSFTMQKFWAFRNPGHGEVARQLTVYFLNAFLGLIINGYLMHLLTNQLGVWYLLSQIIVGLSLGVWNFCIYRFVVFKDKKDENNCQEETIGGSAGDLAS